MTEGGKMCFFGLKNLFFVAGVKPLLYIFISSAGGSFKKLKEEFRINNN